MDRKDTEETIDFPVEHRRYIRTTNSLERINKEFRKRTRVVGVFPNGASCLRLISAILMEISEDWQIGKRYCFSKSLHSQPSLSTIYNFFSMQYASPLEKYFK